METGSEKLEQGQPVESSGAVHLAPSDADAQAAEVLALGLPRVKIRILTQLYDAPRRRYALWRGVSWRLNVAPTPATMTGVRQALHTCLKALTVLGPDQLIFVLEKATKDALPLSPVTEDFEEVDEPTA
jgi:hypothetical protein